jgi:hypothetical protein
MHQRYQNRRRVQMLQERMQEILKEEVYEDFVARVGFELDMCIICALEFNAKDKIISLKCSNK